MKIIALNGSIRKQSFNGMLINFMKERYAGKLDIELLSIDELPHYNQDNELEPGEAVTQFKQVIAAADGVLIATPEFNASISGVLKNALDWISRVDHVMAGKPTMVIGATMGTLGTVRAQIHLRQILASMGVDAPVLPGNEVLVSTVHEKFNEKGELIDESTIQYFDTVVNNYLEWVKKL